MDIAIIGAGRVGGALAGSFTRAGHSVTVTATKEETAREVADRTGARAVEDNRQALQGAEVVVLAVPSRALDAVLEHLGEALDGKIVIDTTNRVNMNDPASTVDGTSNAEDPGSHAWSSRGQGVQHDLRRATGGPGPRRDDHRPVRGRRRR
ncbi:MAG: NADPH-dependent F420 reductase [Actinomycetota bacterium]